MKECIVILGMHRSGTSVLTGLVSLFGVYVGADLMKPTQDNPKGYFENNKIVHLNDKILREQDSSWQDFSFDFKALKQKDIEEYVLEAKSILEQELRVANRCVIKDPRISLLFPVWEQALNLLDVNIKVILSYRNPIEVALSLHKRDEMTIEKGLMLWSTYFFESENYSRKYNRLIVEYDADIKNIKDFLEELGKFVGVKVDQEIFEQANLLYTPALRHHFVPFDNVSKKFPSYLFNIIKLLADKKFNQRKKIDKLKEEFYASKVFFLHDMDEKKAEQEENKQLLIRQAVQIEKSEIDLKTKEIEGIQNQKKITTLQEAIKGINYERKDLKNELAQAKKKMEVLKKNQQEQVIVGNLNLAVIREKNDIIEKNRKTIEKNRKTIEQNRKTIEQNRKTIGQNGKTIERNGKTIEQKYSENEALKLSLRLGGELYNKMLASNMFYMKQKRYNKKLFGSLFYSLINLIGFKKNKLLLEQEIIRKSGLFSSFFYLTVNPDVKKAGINPISHYCQYGWKEGRSPNSFFDTRSYLRFHPDVEKAGVNPFVHYIKSGIKEGRRVSPVVLGGKVLKKAQREANTHVSTNKEKACIKTPFKGVISTEYYEKSISFLPLLQKKKLSNKPIPKQVIGLAIQTLKDKPIKVSVVMPTWNRKNSICKAIDSILGQSYLPYEIIISDDGSTDGTIEYLKQIYREEISDNLIILLQNKHMGVSPSRNIALNRAKGDLIAYLDSDNIWREHYILLMAAAFSESDEVNCAYSALERHDNNSESNNSKNKFLAIKYDRKRLLDGNFIDLNVFVHRRVLFDQFGGFDTELKRLVDWELIIRYTKNHVPVYIPFIGVDYYLDDKNLKNITTTVSLDDNREKVYQGHFMERLRYGLEDLRLAYVLWDFPALSQTFVMEELKWLVQQGHDVIVYFSVEPDKSAVLDFEIESHQVKDADELSRYLEEHQRNFCHSHFAYPTVTRLTYPACTKNRIPFTFMPHAVDIFHHENKKRNKIGEITQHPLCKKVLVHGEFHKKFIEECGVPSEKVAFNIQAVNTADFTDDKQVITKKVKDRTILKGVVITRFVEKKGINTLIAAAALLKDEAVTFDIYGYGPLEEEYRKQIKELGLDNVALKGALTNQQAVSEAYGESDFLITPCVVAENGDMDGFPTVILEAMAMGLPVITTDIAAIPDYLTDGVEAFVAPAGDIEKIADAVRRLSSMSEERKSAMIKRACGFLNKKIGVEKTMQMLLDTWQDYAIDIFLVTFNTEKYDDREETFEIIRRIFKYTTTPFTLTIIDNDSDKDFWDEICSMVKGYPNVRLIRKSQNEFCGPASNIALELSNNEYAIYICSKEGFIKSHGWERALLKHMRDNPNDTMAGHFSQMPKYIYGKEYEKHPDFKKFRNPEFAKKNPDRVFKHVQGGVYIIKREFINKHGGFNPETPHGGMDIEMSYYVESLGYDLGEIPEVASLTAKTRPTLTAITNERTVIAHPLTINNVEDDLDSLVKEKGHRCNVCGWKGESFILESEKKQPLHKCPECGSTGFGRSVMKYMANNQHIHRNEVCVILSADKSLQTMLNKMFKLVLLHTDITSFQLEKQHEVDIYIIDQELFNTDDETEIWTIMLSNLTASGEIVFTDSLFEDKSSLSDARSSTNKNLTKALSQFEEGYSLEYIDYSSHCLEYDWRRISVLRLGSNLVVV